MLSVAVVAALQTTEIFACSVCQGDPDSKLVKGAEAGVLTMVFVTYGLLLSMIGLGATWFVRQRRRLTRVNAGVTTEVSGESKNQDGES
ncbi:MAG: hypothetical protein H6819_08055 [Phycisphaerales bacterium]|nr:hypothetical protein [Phycisphaerales bacterium]MCB9854271.1 hypothetical protein [Phycisphaerales bacterium]